ncbi:MULTISPECIES: SDR family NAD(P)-dependent oxidoreductase [unclassified Streptomyces]|uniref:SDR family NAD(P)-dependent oxidoreductase n=1 Tax=unclassified Streptomyces TaxID=2593676 RepID=UPI00225AA686|nr:MULTISPECIES: SDR family oxidoreductase [unclassified Streptomyces]MCX4527997.1 SDR family oxidoreductase [Streptomyces sp. NBC_01551]MCX4541388.1 SDR family oxidoreductase [Streptomyces sp. NBC_01565]
MGVLKGKTALVTGGSRGIGRAIAERLARDGARVAVHYGHDGAAAEAVVAAIAAEGGEAFAVRAELGVPGDAEALWAAYAADPLATEGVDILVNNAGAPHFGGIGATDEETYDRVQALNAKAPFFVIRHGLARLRDGGRIVNVTGTPDIALPAILATIAAKGAVNALTVSLAAELAPRGITVNSVGPGITDTDLNAAWLADPGARAHAASRSVFGRIGTAQEVADVVAFLASPDSRWITGQHLSATGGLQLSLL